MSLAQALGYGENDRLLLVNADDYGLCHSVNRAVQQLLVEKAVSSATMMMPCGWAKEAALWSAQHPQYDVGIHLTFTSEWTPYSWGPVSRKGATNSLVTNEGYFPTDCETFERQADEGQVKEEIIAQIEMALQLGMKPTHADNHMGSLYGLKTGRNFLPTVLDVCASYGLPFRLPRFLLQEDGQVAPPELEEQARQIAQLADSKGVVILDYLVGLPFQLQDGETFETFKESMKALLKGIRPGVTELIIHPSYQTDELTSFHGQPNKREMERRMFLEPDIQELLSDEHIQLIHWSDLQKLQHKRRSMSN